MYAARPQALMHREYPESDHLVWPEDWHDLWTTTGFLTRGSACRSGPRRLA